MSPMNAKTVLVIDDDPEWREFVYVALGEAYPVQFAENGEEGLLRARELHPDAIVLDVMMPGGQDGFSTLCDLRDCPETCNIPVVMLSEVNAIAHTDFGNADIERYLGTAPAEFVEKPTSCAHLLEVVRRLIEGDTDADPEQT